MMHRGTGQGSCDTSPVFIRRAEGLQRSRPPPLSHFSRKQEVRGQTGSNRARRVILRSYGVRQGQMVPMF